MFEGGRCGERLGGDGARSSSGVGTGRGKVVWGLAVSCRAGPWRAALAPFDRGERPRIVRLDNVRLQHGLCLTAYYNTE